MHSNKKVGAGFGLKALKALSTGKLKVETLDGIDGILTPSSSALLHNGSTIMTGVKSTTKLLDKRMN